MEKQMFIIEFAKKTDLEKGYTYGDRKTIYVIAKDYNEAVRKASMYIENRMQNQPKSVLSSDGSLNNQEIDIFKPVSIKILHEEIVW